NALAVRLQHRAVRSVGAAATRRLAPMVSVACQPRWWLGLVAVGSGASLHIVALGMAPLAVVQPVGVLTLALVVALEAAVRRAWPSRTVVGAVPLTGAAVTVFVVLASGGTPAGPVSTSPGTLPADL